MPDTITVSHEMSESKFNALLYPHLVDLVAEHSGFLWLLKQRTANLLAQCISVLYLWKPEVQNGSHWARGVAGLCSFCRL